MYEYKCYFYEVIWKSILDFYKILLYYLSRTVVHGGEEVTLNINDFEFNNNEPIYFQIIELIKKSIATGELKSGDKLPSVREMSASLGVNPNTLQRAYGELERLGVTYTKRGMGSFVSEEKTSPDELQDKMGREIAAKFLKDMKSIGISKKRALKIIQVMEEE